MSLNYRDWLSPRPLRFDDNLIWLYERFLVGSLAVDASKIGGSFISDLEIVNSRLAEAFLDEHIKIGIEFKFVDSIDLIESSFKEIGGCYECVWSHKEFFICNRTEKSEVTRTIHTLREYQENSACPLGNESNQIVKRRFYEVDSIFRHIRNALAHGCVNTHKIDGQAAVLLFDVTTDDRVTAVASLTFQRLKTWYKCMCGLAKREL